MDLSISVPNDLGQNAQVNCMLRGGGRKEEKENGRASSLLHIDFPYLSLFGYTWSVRTFCLYKKRGIRGETTSMSHTEEFRDLIQELYDLASYFISPFLINICLF